MDTVPILKFHFDLNLQNLSAIAFATRLWKLPVIKKITHDFMNNQSINNKNNNNNNVEKFKYKSWYAATTQIWDYVKLMPIRLPDLIQSVLNDAIVNVGENIFNWIEHLTKILKLDISFTEDIYFTHYGSVDANKTFNLCWAKNLRADELSDNNFSIFLVSTIFAQVTFIDKHKNEMIKYEFCNSARKQFEVSKDKVYVVMTAWLCHYIIKKKEFDVPMKLRLTLGGFDPYRMFDLCVAVGFNDAARYYYNFIYASEAFNLGDFNALLERTIETCFKKIRAQLQTASYLKEKQIEILLNVLNALPVKERLKFILKENTYFLRMLFTYPFHCFYPLILKYVIVFLSDNDFMVLISDIINNKIVKDSESNCPIKKYIYKVMLLTTWSRMKDSSKEFVLLNSRTLSSLFRVKDYSCIGALLNVKFLSKNFDFLKLDLYQSILRFVNRGYFNCLNRFLRECFSPDECEIFKLKIISILDVFILNDNYDRADRVLELMTASTTYPKSYYKNQIEPKHIIQTFLKYKKNDLVEKFLLWRFATEKERSQIKAELGMN